MDTATTFRRNLADHLGADFTVEHGDTGGGCTALEVRHTTSPDAFVLVTDGDAEAPGCTPWNDDDEWGSPYAVAYQSPDGEGRCVFSLPTDKVGGDALLATTFDLAAAVRAALA